MEIFVKNENNRIIATAKNEEDILGTCQINIENNTFTISSWYTNKQYLHQGIGKQTLKNALIKAVNLYGEPNNIEYIWNGANDYVIKFLENNFDPINKCPLAVLKYSQEDVWESHIYKKNKEKVLNYFHIDTKYQTKIEGNTIKNILKFNDSTAGFCSIFNNYSTWYIRSWNIDRNYRNLGFGQNLLKNTIQKMENEFGDPYHVVYLWDKENEYVKDYLMKIPDTVLLENKFIFNVDNLFENFDIERTNKMQISHSVEKTIEER